MGDEELTQSLGGQPFIPSFGHPRESNDWMRDAACVGPSSALFFSDSRQDREEAKRICLHCPVLLDCADYSARITSKEHGVFAGGKEARQYVASRRAQADADRQTAAKADPARASAQKRP